MTAPPHVEGRLPGTGKGKGYHFLRYHRISVEALHLFMTIGGKARQVTCAHVRVPPRLLPILRTSQEMHLPSAKMLAFPPLELT